MLFTQFRRAFAPGSPRRPDRLAAFSVGLGLFVAACSGGGSSSSGGRFFVSVGGAGTGDGSSWQNASGDVQAAIDRAHAGDEIWIAAGVYTPSLPPAAAPAQDPRTATFHLKSGVALRGGFAGGESSPSQRTLLAGPSVLSGDLAGDDGPDFANTSENAYHVVMAIDVDGSGTLEDLTIRGGRADGIGLGPSPDSQDQGSGLDIFNASPRVIRCVFEGNWSKNHGAANDHGVASSFEQCTFQHNHSDLLGGGLYIHHHSSTLVVECHFVGNTAAQHGAGSYCRSHEGARYQACDFRDNTAVFGAGMYVSEGGTPEVAGCTFEDNLATLGGGGLYSDQSFPHVTGSTFTRNQAGVKILDGGGGGGGSGGGGIWGVGGAPVVEDCTFERNQASFGAGVYFIEFCSGIVRRSVFSNGTALEAGGLYTLQSDALVEDCLFRNNRAEGGVFSVGGGMSNYFSNSTTRRCTFIGNVAELGGGGQYSEGMFPNLLESRFIGNRAIGTEEGWGGGVMYGYFCHGLAENSLFVGNESHRGGGLIAMVLSDPRIVNCTFVDNRAPEGAGLYAFDLAAPELENSIVWGNLPDGVGGGGTITRYSCVQDGARGESNLPDDPSFASLPAPGPDGVYGTADDELTDCALSAASPCIDAGDNGALDLRAEPDLLGHPRFVDDPGVIDRGVPSPPVVDLGAIERP